MLDLAIVWAAILAFAVFAYVVLDGFETEATDCILHIQPVLELERDLIGSAHQ